MFLICGSGCINLWRCWIISRQRVSNIKSFINKYNWKRINYLSKIDDQKTFENNNPTVALNILYIKECPGYISKINSNFEKQIILLMIRN